MLILQENTWFFVQSGTNESSCCLSILIDELLIRWDICHRHSNLPGGNCVGPSSQKCPFGTYQSSRWKAVPCCAQALPEREALSLGPNSPSRPFFWVFSLIKVWLVYQVSRIGSTLSSLNHSALFFHQRATIRRWRTRESQSFNEESGADSQNAAQGINAARDK